MKLLIVSVFLSVPRSTQLTLFSHENVSSMSLPDWLSRIGTLSIDNEMHDDDVCNPRRIGSRVSFSD